MGVLISEQCWAELHAFVIQLYDTEVAKRLLPESRLRKNISGNLFHCCSIADVNSEENTQKGEPMEWLREGMPSAATQPQWGRLTDRSRNLRGVCSLSIALIQFSPHVSMQCLQLSDVGLPVCSMVSHTSLHGWTWSPLNGFISSLMRAQLQQEERQALPSWSYPTKPFPFLNPGPSLLSFLL